jgi:preprotein translocase subunit SecG
MCHIRSRAGGEQTAAITESGDSGEIERAVTWFKVLSFVLRILCFVFCVLSFVFCVLCFVFGV